MISINQQLTAFFVSRYNGDNSRLKFIVDGSVSKVSIVPIYNQFIKEKMLTPVERLSDEEKEEIRQELLKYDIPLTVISAKILHTIKFINENS